MADYAMFRPSTPHGIVLLILYVDDMVITGSVHVAIASMKRHLQSDFEMKDLGFLCYFLGIEVACSSHGYLLSQQKYIADLLERATLSDPATPTSSPVFTPMELHLKLRHDDGSLHDTENWWDLLYSFLLFDQIFLRMFMSSVSLSVLPHQFIMRHYFVCFVIFETPSLDHCCIVLIRLFLCELILTLDGPMIRTHAAPPHVFAFF